MQTGLYSVPGDMRMTGWYLRDLEARTMNPPTTDAPDEPCFWGNHDLGSIVYYLPTYDQHMNELLSFRRYVCAGCLREERLAYYRKVTETCLADPPEEAYPAEPCERCAYYKCRCPE
jgi:hypothetical protein